MLSVYEPIFISWHIIHWGAEWIDISTSKWAMDAWGNLENKGTYKKLSVDILGLPEKGDGVRRQSGNLLPKTHEEEIQQIQL